MGIVLSTGVLIYLSTQFKFLKKELKNQNINKYIPFILFITSGLISSIFSIEPVRSFKVLFYLFLFVIFSYFLFLILKEKRTDLENILNVFYLSSHFNIFFVLIYVLLNFSCKNCVPFEGVSSIIENLSLVSVTERFKGFLNIFTLNLIFVSFLKSNRFNVITLVCLIPCLILSNCNTAIFGIILATLVLVFFNILKLKLNSKTIFTCFLLIGILTFFNLTIYLPKTFEKQEIENFEPVISTKLFDVHRQFMWGFSLDQFKKKPLFGFGPDTSNFIKEGQREIGSKFTGEMFFVSSHPHNFFIEILLELGIIGMLFFLFFIFYFNYLTLTRCDSKGLNLFIFFNIFFWGTSLLNFSFWLGWWQASYYFIFSLLAAKFYLAKN